MNGMQDRDNQSVPFPEGDAWNHLGQRVRRIARNRRRRTRILASVPLLLVGAVLLAALWQNTGKDEPGTAVLALEQAPQPVPAAHNEYESLNLLMLQVDIDSVGVALRCSGLHDDGVRDEDLWQALGVDPLQVFSQYMELL